MLLKSLRNLSGSTRSESANAHLGYCLAFIAGAVNAGGFLAVGQYTSHMTGIVSAMADNIALGLYSIVIFGLGILTAFTFGAAITAILVNVSRSHNLQSTYALPLLLEAALLLCFGLLGTLIDTREGTVIYAITLLLSFIMGLQNAVITKLSKSIIRTTHVTGIMTDIGIEMGKLVYQKSSKSRLPQVVANTKRLQIHTLLVVFFFIGGVLGALGFKTIGYFTTLPLSAILLILAAIPVFDDLKQSQR